MTRHFSEGNGDQGERIIALCQKIACLPQRKRPFNVFQFVQGWTNRKGHPLAIERTLYSLAKYWHEIGNPYGYANKTMRTVNGTYNEADAVRESERFKSAMVTDERLKQLIGSIGQCKSS